MIYQSLKVNKFLYNLGVFWLFAMAFLIAVAPAPYLHDFAEWLYQGQILALKISDPQSVAGYTLAPYPVPNSLAPALLAILCFLFEPILAGKIFLIVLLLGWLWTIRIFVKTYVPEHTQGSVILLFVSVVVFASFFWYGFVSYQLGLLLLIVFISSYHEKWSLSSMIGIGILLFLSHAMIFLVWCLFLGLLFLSGQGRFRQSVLLTFLYIAPLPIWFVLGRQLSGFVAPVADARLAGVMEFLLLKLASPAQHGGFRNMIQPDGSSLLEYHAWVYGLGTFSTLMVVIMLTIFVFMAFFQTYIKYMSDESGPGCNLMTFKGDGISPEGDFENNKSGKSFVVILRKLGIVLMVLYCVAPFNFFGLIDPGSRLLLPLFVLALLVADETSFKWLRRAALPALVGVSISIFSYAALIYQAADDKNFAYQGPPPSGESPPKHSVVAFNDWAYRNTRYRYFNFRVFAFADRFRQLQLVNLSGLGFRTGPITSYNPVSN